MSSPTEGKRKPNLVADPYPLEAYVHSYRGWYVSEVHESDHLYGSEHLVVGAQIEEVVNLSECPSWWKRQYGEKRLPDNDEWIGGLVAFRSLPTKEWPSRFSYLTTDGFHGRINYHSYPITLMINGIRVQQERR